MRVLGKNGLGMGAEAEMIRGDRLDRYIFVSEDCGEIGMCVTWQFI